MRCCCCSALNGVRNQQYQFFFFRTEYRIGKPTTPHTKPGPRNQQHCLPTYFQRWHICIIVFDFASQMPWACWREGFNRRHEATNGAPVPSELDFEDNLAEESRHAIPARRPRRRDLRVRLGPRAALLRDVPQRLRLPGLAVGRFRPSPLSHHPHPHHALLARFAIRARLKR